MKKITTVFLVITSLFLFVSVIFAQPHRGGVNRRGVVGQRMTGRHMQGRILNLLRVKKDELNITDEQLENIKALMFEREERMIEYRSSMNKKRLELKKLLHDAKNRDYQKIKDLLSQRSEIRNNLFIEGMKTREDIYNVLTPEQKQAIKAAIEERWEKRKPLILRRRLLKEREGRGFLPRIRRFQK